MGDVSADQILSLFAHLHMDGRFGPPTESLQAHGAGSGKDVEKKLVFDHRAKQVKDRLSPEVARWPDRLVHRAFQLESFSFASNDSHLSAQTSRFIRKLVARAILDPSLKPNIQIGLLASLDSEMNLFMPDYLSHWQSFWSKRLDSHHLVMESFASFDYYQMH